MSDKRNTDKYRRRMKRQHANSIARKQHEDFELQVWHQHLAEQRKQHELAAKALKNGRKDLVDHLASLFWLRLYQQDPVKAQSMYKLLEMKRMLHAVCWRQGPLWKMISVNVPILDFGESISEPFDPQPFWDLYNS